MPGGRRRNGSADLQTALMGFDLPGLLAARRGEGYELHARYLNPQLPRMLHAIGFDKVYERARVPICTIATATPTPTS